MAPTFSEVGASENPGGVHPASFVMSDTLVEVQFTSAGCLNYPCRTPPGDKLVAEIKALIAELPIYSYRRVYAILKRQALAAGLKPPNHKRVCRVMKVYAFC